MTQPNESDFVIAFKPCPCCQQNMTEEQCDELQLVYAFKDKKSADGFAEEVLKKPGFAVCKIYPRAQLKLVYSSHPSK